MNTAKKEYLGILCKLYLIGLLAVLPLYLPDGYYMQGDSKYFLFRNCSFLCLGIWVVTEVTSFLLEWFQGWSGVKQSAGQSKLLGSKRLGTVDIFMLAYGVCVLLSAVCSDYDTAWNGYTDWYMGAVSQLMFVGIYFLVSRYYDYDRWSIYAAEGAFLAVVVIGLLARLGIDVLGVYQGFRETDWGSSNLISTIGNINWFCGYCSVALAFPISGFMYGGKKIKTGILYGVSVLGLVLLVIQGSDSGPVLAAVGIGCCLLMGVKKIRFFKKTLLLLTGMSVGVYLMGLGIRILDTWYATPVESWIYNKMTWSGWLVLGAVAILFYGGCSSLEKRGHGVALHRLIKILIGVVLLTLGTICFFILLKWSQGDLKNWGSGRGILWRLALEGFGQADLVGKLIGAGPDCFAEYLYGIGKSTVITTEGYWTDAIFANAHNEWLNHLVNIGILGMGCYAGIFISAIRRYRGMLLAVLVLAMYGVHSLVSFQQVLNTPLLFCVLGICENQYRRVKEQYI